MPSHHPLLFRSTARIVACTVALVLTAAFATQAFAQDGFPNRPLQIIVPTGPGGGTDTAARLLARVFNERLKWQVVVVNRLGAGTRLAGESVAKAAPDDYTLLMGINALATGPLVYNSMPYDALRDFAPVSLVLVVPYLLVVHPSLPAKTPRELVLRLQRETAAVLREPSNVRTLVADGGRAVGSTPEEFAAFMKVDTDKWTRLAKTISITKEEWWPRFF